MFERITYTIERTPDPDIRGGELVTMKNAAQQLGVSVQTIDYYIRSGQLSAIVKTGSFVAHNRPKRWVLRNELEAVAQRLTEESETES